MVQIKNQIEIVNLVPKFLEFYEEAIKTNGEIASIFPLWEKYYGFAAVPPGEEGQEIARQLLADSWGRYGEVMQRLKQFAPNESDIHATLEEVKEQLNYKESISIAVLFFVGSFEKNPFVAPYGDGRIALCLPVETELSKIELAHELTHIVHSKTAKLSMNWERPLGLTVLEEGLAMRMSQLLVPDRTEASYVEHSDGWLMKARDKKDEILRGILPFIEQSSSEAMMKFTFGTGTTGLEREVYFVGWELVGQLVNSGHSLAELAHIPEEKVPLFVEKHLKKLI